MDFYPSRQEAVIIQYVGIVWTSWELYRDWDKTSKRLVTIYDWFTSKSEEDDVQPPPNENPQR